MPHALAYPMTKLTLPVASLPMTSSNWVTQISVWDLIRNGSYQSRDCKKVLRAASTRQLEEETKVEILVLQSCPWLFLYNRIEMETLSSLMGK